MMIREKSKNSNTAKKSLIMIFFIVIIGLSVRQAFSRAPQPPEKSTVDYSSEFKEQCEKLSIKKFACYGRAFHLLAREKGHAFAFDTLLSLQKEDPDTVQCHLIAHQIGRGAYEHDKDKWRDVITDSSTFCSRGIPHGVIEAYLSTLPPGNIFEEKTLKNICDEKAPTSCYHVIGHVLLVEYKGEIDNAITKCKVFSGGRGYADCLNGTFMEHVWPKTLIDHGLADKTQLELAPRVENLISLCNNQKDKEIISICWAEMARPIAVKYDYEPIQSFKHCNTAPNTDAALECRTRLIGLIAINEKLDFAKVKYICKIIQPLEKGFEKNCYDQLARVGVINLPPSKTADMISFCTSLDSKFQKDCIGMTGRTLRGRVNQAYISEFCKKAPEQFQTSCLYGRKNEVSRELSLD